MNNTTNSDDKSFVWRDSNNEEAYSNGYENNIDEGSKESNRMQLSSPIIIGTVGLFILVVFFIVFFSRSQNYEEQEHVLVMEKRLDKLESEFTALKKLITSKLDQAIKQMEDHNHKTINRKVPVIEKPPIKQNEQSDVESKVHKVQAGDSLYKISLQYGLSIELLLGYNNLKPNAMIYPGQVIKLTPQQ